MLAMHVLHLIHLASGTTTLHIVNLGALTYGLAAIGPGIGIGLVFGHAIEGGLKRAEDAQEEATRVLGQYQAQLAEARHDAARLREVAKEEAAQIVAQGRADGAAERQRLIDSASAQIEADRQHALAALRAEVGTLAVELASKIVGESLADEARQARMVDRFLAEIEAEPAGTGAAGTRR